MKRAEFIRRMGSGNWAERDVAFAFLADRIGLKDDEPARETDCEPDCRGCSRERPFKVGDRVCLEVPTTFAYEAGDVTIDEERIGTITWISEMCMLIDFGVAKVNVAGVPVGLRHADPAPVEGYDPEMLACMRDCAQLRADLAAMTKERDDYKSLAETVAGQLKLSSEGYWALHEENAELESRAEKAERDLAAMTKEQDTVRRENTEWHRWANNASASLRAGEDEDVNEAAERVREEYDAAIARAEKAERERDEANERAERIVKLCNIAADRAEKAERERDEARDNEDALERERDEAEATRKRTSEQNVALLNENDDLKWRVTDIDRRIAEAVAAEREACAVLVESMHSTKETFSELLPSRVVINAIRARGEVKS